MKNKSTTSQPSKPNDTQSIDGGVTAQPTGDSMAAVTGKSKGVVSGSTEYGEMNLEDAKESGYTDDSGQAVSTPTRQVKGSPTGALTDIGEGRSSAIRKH